MPQSLQTSVDAVASAREIKIFELRPVEIHGKVVTDTTTISMSVNQALRLQRRLAEAIAAASDDVYSNRQTAMWSEATLRAIASRRVSV